MLALRHGYGRETGAEKDGPTSSNQENPPEAHEGSRANPEEADQRVLCQIL